MKSEVYPDEVVLSTRETEVLVALANGWPTHAIATALGIASTTVETHISNARRKLGARTRAEAVAKGFRLGVLT